MGGEGGVVLFAREALLLGRRDDLSVTDQAGGAVVIISGYPKDIYRLHRIPACSSVLLFLPYFHKICQPGEVSVHGFCHGVFPAGKNHRFGWLSMIFMLITD
jgi:hypothetical protein